MSILWPRVSHGHSYAIEAQVHRHSGYVDGQARDLAKQARHNTALSTYDRYCSILKIPPGNYQVIASLKKADNSIVKVRSAEVVIELKNEKASAPDLGLAQANKMVTGVLLDAEGKFLPPETLLTLWGEKFHVGEDGKYC